MRATDGRLTGRAGADKHVAQLLGTAYTAPPEVYALLAAGAGLSLVGGIQLAGEFRPMSSFLRDQVREAEKYRPAFMTFNHRGTLAGRSKAS